MIMQSCLAGALLAIGVIAALCIVYILIGKKRKK